MKKIIIMLASAVLLIGTSCAKKVEAGSNVASDDSLKSGNTEMVASGNAGEHGADSLQHGSNVKTLAADVRGVDILPSITKGYEGKVTLIDFWATWCPPCRRAMTEIDAIKGELLAKGVHFVYITGETSPQKDWDNMIKNIEGDHYRLTETQWSELCSQLAIPGIPAYLLINKDGSVAYSNLSEGGYPGNELIKNQIEVALTK